jgi:hypothetical protein
MTRPLRPDSLVICGQPFEVRWDARSHGRLLDHNEGDDLGSVAPSDQLIVIREHQAPHSMRDSLLHEVIHAAVALTGHDQAVEHDALEGLTGSLAVALLSTLRENPELVAWLTEPL